MNYALRLLQDPESFFNRVPFVYGDTPEEKTASWKTHFAESEKQFELTLDVPGVKKEDLKIELKDGELTVSGKRTLGYEQAFSNSYRLPEMVDVEKIEAQHHNGVLHVTVPKAELAKPREIKIQDFHA